MGLDQVADQTAECEEDAGGGGEGWRVAVDGGEGVPRGGGVVWVGDAGADGGGVVAWVGDTGGDDEGGVLGDCGVAGRTGDC